MPFFGGTIGDLGANGLFASSIVYSPISPFCHTSFPKTTQAFSEPCSCRPLSADAFGAVGAIPHGACIRSAVTVGTLNFHKKDCLLQGSLFFCLMRFQRSAWLHDPSATLHDDRKRWRYTLQPSSPQARRTRFPWSPERFSRRNMQAAPAKSDL